MSELKVAACIITGDQYDEKEVKELLKSLEGNVHGIFVNYNGTKTKLPWQKWTTTPLVYKKFKWEDDFALARNQSFSLVPRDEYDYYLWIDTDDKLIAEPGAVQEMLHSLDEYSSGVFIRYAYAVEPKTNIVVVEQWRERFLSTKEDWEWQFVIHEVCKSPHPVQFAQRDSVYIEHQRKNGEERGARDRNRRIIAKALEKYPNESRYLFYFAGETMAEADTLEYGPEKLALADAAILAFNNYREMVNDINEDIYLATIRISELYRMKRDFGAALETDMEAIALYPNWPDGYVGAAKTCLEIRDFRRMKDFADIATKLDKPITAASMETMNSGFTPIFLRGIANEELGHHDQAANDYETALTYWTPPDTKTVEEKIVYLRELKDKVEEEDKRKTLRGSKTDKSICFFTQPIPDVWHPETLKKGGAGGAETCIMKLAPMFAADGWRVVVFGTPGEYRGEYEGVEYWNTEEYLPKEKFKVFVSSRSTAPFEGKVNADASFLWMHDVNIGEKLFDVKDVPDKIVGLTDWHANHLSNLYGIDSSKLTVIPNGIDLERFPRERWNNENNQNKFIYSSSPDRGLEHLLGMWEMLRSRYGNLELHIYYGWTIIDKIIEFYNSTGQTGASNYQQQFKTKILHHIDYIGGEDAGIYQHGRINQHELAEKMMDSLVWAYPTQFMETFAITAVEMQAAGVIPVTANLAALKETVAPFYERIEGWPGNSDFQKRFLTELAFVMDTPEYRAEGRELGRIHAEQYTWENAYKIWNENIKSVI